jgi:hypothetical protein
MPATGRILTAAAGAGCAVLAALLWACESGHPAADRAEVTLNGTTWRVEVADTSLEQRRGLSGRRGLEERGGMLFVFDRSEPRSFWMRDCHIPLDIAFLAEDGTVLNLETMHVEPDPSRPVARYESDGPARYVLEVAGGELKRAGVQAGHVAEIRGL